MRIEDATFAEKASTTSNNYRALLARTIATRSPNATPILCHDTRARLYDKIWRNTEARVIDAYRPVLFHSPSPSDGTKRRGILWDADR